VPAGLVTPGIAAGAPGLGDAERGEVVFQKCYACHSVVPGETGLTGPNLFGMIGRAVASAPDFEYSAALERLRAQGYPAWTEAALDGFMKSPEDFAPRHRDDLRRLADPDERADVIAYLAAARPGRGEE
jgi:cytochrome c